VTIPALAAPQESGNNEVIFMALDLASLASVRAFATAFLSSEPRLDILIHNAGEGQKALQGGGGWPGAVAPSIWALPGASRHMGRMPHTPIAHMGMLRAVGQLTSSSCPRDQFLWPDP
jgi:NAD(P)-dependent dehydrogenase (short-subunit alcohol dehydrogenase family)